MWLPSSLVYNDLDLEKFDFDNFDEIQEPPPVHIIYPRPSFNNNKTSKMFSHKISCLVQLMVSLVFLGNLNYLPMR